MFRSIANVFFSLVCIVTVFVLVWQLASSYFFKNAIPQNLEITHILLQETHPSLRESCGGVVFKISQATVDRIQEEGISFLNTDKVGRGYHFDRETTKSLYYTYEDWAETPAPHSWTSEGIPASFGCMLKDTDKKYSKVIFNALRNPGSFFTTKDEGQILLIPSEKLLVYGFNG